MGPKNKPDNWQGDDWHEFDDDFDDREEWEKEEDEDE